MANPPSERELISKALIAVVCSRFEAFLERFGREPGPDEPLLFDPQQDDPAQASADERLLQIKHSADAANVDATLLLHRLGYLSSRYVS